MVVHTGHTHVIPPAEREGMVFSVIRTLCQEITQRLRTGVSSVSIACCRLHCISLFVPWALSHPSREWITFPVENLRDIPKNYL